MLSKNFDNFRVVSGFNNCFHKLPSLSRYNVTTENATILDTECYGYFGSRVSTIAETLLYVSMSHHHALNMLLTCFLGRRNNFWTA